MKCVACGSTSLVEGSLTDTGSAQDISFTVSGASLLRRVFRMGTRPVRAHGCTHCGHLQLSVEFSESDFEHYQQFEGAQPDVLERLGAEDGENSTDAQENTDS